MEDIFEGMDALFSEARATINAGRRAAEAAARLPRRIKAADSAPEPDQSFIDPANWKRTRGIALIHEETQTLLGNFTEYLHPTGARRLLREDAPMLVSGTEVVSGDWWISRPPAVPQEETEWYTKRMAIVPIHLPKLGVHSPAVEVLVHLSFGGIARVELAMDEMFAQASGQDQLLFLPKHTNILQEMSQDCKINLRLEVSKHDPA